MTTREQSPMLTECNYVVLFPSATVGRQMKLIIDKIGVSKGIEKQITTYKTSRSLLIHKTYPMYCVMDDKNNASKISLINLLLLDHRHYFE